MTRLLPSITKGFKSVRLTVALLLLLAATSVLGTLIPQNKHAADYIQAFGEPLHRLFQILDLTDMYRAWWFVLLILLLALNILACTVSRFRATIKLAFGTGFKGFASLPVQAQRTIPHPPEGLEAPLKKALSARFAATRELSTLDGYALEAEKGRWTRVGADLVHVGILILLAGAVIGSRYGFDGFVNVPEGETVSAITLRDSNETMPLGFSVRCDDFSISHYDSGDVKEYRSRLAIVEGGKEVVTKEIVVNDPLTHKGVTFYQASYGSLGATGFTLSFTEKATGRVVTHPMAIGESVAFAPGRTFTFDRYDANYAFNGKPVGEAVVGTLSQGEKPPAEVVLLTRFPSFDKMRKGEWVIAATDHDHAYYTGLQVTRDPGVGLVYTGFLLMLTGCGIAFFLSHKKIRVEISPAPEGCTITLFGSAGKSNRGIKRDAQKILADLPLQ